MCDHTSVAAFSWNREPFVSNASKHSSVLSRFFFNETATTEIYTLSLHDALPIFDLQHRVAAVCEELDLGVVEPVVQFLAKDRKSTRLNSSHITISYAVFCLKKKKKW